MQGVIAGQCSCNDVITAAIALEMTPYNEAPLQAIAGVLAAKCLSQNPPACWRHAQVPRALMELGLVKPSESNRPPTESDTGAGST